MSLETVIKIGKLYREHPNAWLFHEQINSVKKDLDAIHKKKNKQGELVKTVFYDIPVIEDENCMHFAWEHIQNEISEINRESLYYLNFKTSKKDTSKKYLFGDIAYAGFTDHKNVFSESGNYRMKGAWEDKQNKEGVWSKKSSFWVCEETAQGMQNEYIRKFRDEFRANIEKIEHLLKSHDSVVIHFNFNNRSWREFEGIIESIDQNLVLGLVKPHSDGEHVVLNKYLYKSLGGVPPGFRKENTYKSKLFTSDEIISLLYASTATETPVVQLSKSLGIIALPHTEDGTSITPEDIVEFYTREKRSHKLSPEQESSEEDKESNVQDTVNDREPMLEKFTDNPFANRIKYDLVFTSIPSSPSGVYADLIEILNVEKSLLVHIHNSIQDARIELETQRKQEFPNTKFYSLNIKDAFTKILGDLTKDKKRVHSHLLKVLPKIYTNSYYSDPVLLPALIEKVEYGIRNSTNPFGFLKYEYYFLINIQKHQTMNHLAQTQSYQLGQYLGTMARPFASWKDDCPIKSFEKQHIGNLSRNIATLDKFYTLAIFIQEKLTMHAKPMRPYKKEFEASRQLNDFLPLFSEKYNKHYCALGFFESFSRKGVKSEEENIEESNNINI